MNRHDLAGRRVVVTGGAGGIGLACAHIGKQVLQPLSAADIEAAFAFIGIGAHDFDIIACGIFLDFVALVFG